MNLKSDSLHTLPLSFQINRGQSSTKVSYFRGNDPDKWQKQINRWPCKDDLDYHPMEKSKNPKTGK